MAKSMVNLAEKLTNNFEKNQTFQASKDKNVEKFTNLGYTCLDGIGLYKLYSSNLTWNEARKSCRKDSAHLAIVNSEREALVNKSNKKKRKLNNKIFLRANKISKEK